MRIAAACLVALCACGKTDAPTTVAWLPLASGEARARAEHRPAVVFVHAQWSVADVELEKKSFPSPEVRRAMRGFVAISVDVTDEDAPETALAQKRFRVQGVPTIVVTDDLDAYPPSGSPDPNAADLFRAHEYMPAEKLAAAIDGARRRSQRWHP